MKKNLLSYLPFLGIFAALILVFFPTVNTYFSQDDWVFLSHVYKWPWSDVFRYYSEAFYRPVGQQLFFKIGSVLFGLNPIGYHVVALGIHAVNALLLWKILHSFKRMEYLSWFLVVFYAFHPVHLIALNWLTQVDIEIAVTLALLTILLFEKNFILSGVTFIAAMLSHETAAMLPIIMLLKGQSLRTQGLSFSNEKGPTLRLQGRTLRGKWIMLAFAALVVLSIKYLANPFPFQSDYSLRFHPIQLFSTIKWYVLRALYLPEGIRQLPEYVQVLSVLSFASLVTVFRWRLIKGLVVFVISLLPVLFLSQHAFSVYAVIPVMFMTIELARRADPIRLGRIGAILVALLLFVASFSISRAVIPTHWTTTRGEISRKLTQEFLKRPGPLISSRSDPSAAERSDLSIFPPASEPSFASMMGKQFEILLR